MRSRTIYRHALAETAQSRGVQLDIACKIDQARIDPHQLGRALDNLVTNALHHVAACM